MNESILKSGQTGHVLHIRTQFMTLLAMNPLQLNWSWVLLPMGNSEALIIFLSNSTQNASSFVSVYPSHHFSKILLCIISIICEITSGPCSLIGSQQCDLYTNSELFKSNLHHTHVNDTMIKKVYCLQITHTTKRPFHSIKHPKHILYLYTCTNFFYRTLEPSAFDYTEESIDETSHITRKIPKTGRVFNILFLFFF